MIRLFSSTVALLLFTLNTSPCLGQYQDDRPQEATWIECYHCNSEYDPRCGDPFDPYSLGKVNCSLLDPLEHIPDKKPVLCRKNVQKIQGKTRVIRGCGYIEDEREFAPTCLRRSGTHDVQLHFCSCKGNFCNNSPLTSISTACLALSTLLCTIKAIL